MHTGLKEDYLDSLSDFDRYFIAYQKPIKRKTLTEHNVINTLNLHAGKHNELEK